MAPQITYKYLPPGIELTDEEIWRAEAVCVRQVEAEDIVRSIVGDIVQLPDDRHGGEERSFKVVDVGNPTHTGFVGEPATAIENTNVFVTDTGSVSFR